MGQPLLANYGVSISELKKNPSAVIAEAEGGPVAILNRNVPAAYLVPPEAWEAMLDLIEDYELAQLVREREGEPTVKVRIEDL
jgi:antitoxin StbD